MINNSNNTNKTNNHLSSQIIEQKSTIIYDKNSDGKKFHQLNKNEQSRSLFGTFIDYPTIVWWFGIWLSVFTYNTSLNFYFILGSWSKRTIEVNPDAIPYIFNLYIVNTTKRSIYDAE